jgi:soluble lytic murein transglycosylase-like protein/outer membrane protein assembly factor BamD (BamD/ComL family)
MAAGAYALSLASFDICPVYETASDLMVRGEYAQAIERLRRDSTVSDSAAYYFRLGIAGARSGAPHEALQYLYRSTRDSSALAACAYEHIGKIQMRSQGKEYAISAFRSAAGMPIIPYRYKIYLQRHIFHVAHTDTSLRQRMRWFNYAFFATEPVHTARQVLSELLDDVIASQQWDRFDSLLAALGKAQARAHICSLVCNLDKRDLPDSVFGTQRCFQLSQLLYKCGSYAEASAWLHKALDREDFTGKVSRREYLAYRLQLNYKLKNYNKSIHYARQFLDEYEPTPGVVITLARNYRYIGERTQSAYWYDKHIEMFPHVPMTVNILWYRAWQREENGNLEEAAQLFHTLNRRYGKSSKADDALFREGLCYYKREEFEKAQDVFDELIDRYRYTAMQTTGRYWKARCAFRLHNHDRAREILHSIFSYSTVDYYAYRAREMLTLLQDTVDMPAFTTVASDSLALQWLLQHAPEASRCRLEPRDSVMLYTGVHLALSGLQEQSEFYLNPISYTYQDDYRLQLFLAKVFSLYDNPTYAYRSAREILRSVPLQARHRMPRRLYSMLYPAPFAHTVKEKARHYEIDPLLVYAVMRQESIFDREIVSPAGAVGLMQLMPYTAKKVARQLEKSYHSDSLYRGMYNITLGTRYLSGLLDKYDNNTILALCAYNAGPGNADRWYAANKSQSFDMFVENISYSETRKYVKRVLANYWTYKRLYADGEYT